VETFTEKNYPEMNVGFPGLLITVKVKVIEYQERLQIRDKRGQ